MLRPKPDPPPVMSTRLSFNRSLSNMLVPRLDRPCLPTRWLALTITRLQRECRAGPAVSENIVAETAARIFADLADPQAVNSAKDDGWQAPLWQALADAGLTLAWVPEQHGGSDASLADGFAVLWMAGRFAVPVPLAETLMAGWLLSRAGIASPAGPMTVAPVRPDDRITLHSDGTLSGRARGVPFAEQARYLAVLATGVAGTVIALVDRDACGLSDGRSLAGDALNGVTLERSETIAIAAAPAGFDQQSLMLMGGTARSVQTAGALEAILALSVRYANERVAFERPIAKFQAVQHNLARLAGEAGEIMLHRLELGDRPLEGDALVGIANRERENCLERSRGLNAARRPAHQHQGLLVEAGRRRGNCDRFAALERHAVQSIPGEAATVAQAAGVPVDECDHGARHARRQHRKVPGLFGERNAAGAAAQSAVGMERDAVVGAYGSDRHGSGRRCNPGAREKPAGD